jgi:hypothetical protein
MALRMMQNPIEVFIPYRQMRRRIYLLLHPDEEDNITTPPKDEEIGKGGAEASIREVKGKYKWKKPIGRWQGELLANLTNIGIVVRL